MNLTIDISEQNAAELETAAREAHMPPDRYLSKIVAHALETRHNAKVQHIEAHLDHMAAQVVPGTSPDEMEAALDEALGHVRQHRVY